MKSNIQFIYIFAIILLANTYSKAQFNAGDSFLQGSLNVNQSLSSSSNMAGQKTYAIGVDWGKYSTKNTARILSLNINYTDQSYQTSALQNKVLNIGLNKGHEYYKSIFGKIGIYGRIMGGVNYGNLQSKTLQNSGSVNYTQQTTNSLGLNLFGNGGIMYRLNDKWAFTGNLLNLNVANLNYAWTDGKISPLQGGTTENFTQKQFNYSFTPSLAFSYGLGIRYIIK